MKKYFLTVFIWSWLMHGPQAQESLKNLENIDSLMKNLLSQDVKIRETSLLNLLRLSNNQKSKLSYSKSNEIFQGLIKMNASPNYINKSVYLLTKFSRDEQVANLSASILKQKDPSVICIIGALTYLEVYDPVTFKNYFVNREYSEINHMLRMVFSTNNTVLQIRQEYYRKLINSYTSWTPKRNAADNSNPFRKQILAEGNKIVPTIIDLYSNANSIPVSIIWLLGEIGDSMAFDMLLKEYLRTPSPRTAISIGSCLGSLNINKIFVNTFKSEDDLFAFLKDLYGLKWEEVKKMKVNEIKAHMIDNLIDIKKSCKSRSIPELG